jgi:hypothetical protein
MNIGGYNKKKKKRNSTTKRGYSSTRVKRRVGVKE